MEKNVILPARGAFAERLQGVGMRTEHCLRKVNLAAVPDELMREGTKAKVWGHLLYPQPCLEAVGNRIKTSVTFFCPLGMQERNSAFL